MNCALTNSSSFKMILSFYHAKSHLFQNLKQLEFSQVFYSATRNLGLKIFPRIENTT